MSGEPFVVRKLLWEQVTKETAESELRELESVVGSYLIEENDALRQELFVLAEILADFQQQNDHIREALASRERVPEPPGRDMLVKRIKLLAAELHSKAVSSKELEEDKKMLEYVLTNTSKSRQIHGAISRRDSLESTQSLHDDPDVVLLRPGTASSARPMTPRSQRPESRCSTSSALSASFESLQQLQKTCVQDIDAIRGDLYEALREEKQLLLDDIDFLQSCLDMEQDLIDSDRREACTNAPPSIQQLQQFQKKLESTLETQYDRERLEKPLCSGKNTFRLTSSKSVKVLQIRHKVQESRDEPFFTL